MKNPILETQNDTLFMDVMPTVFICEDEGVIALDLQKQLSEFSIVIGKSSSAEKTIEAFELRVPDLFVCDIAIKGEMDGIELSKFINKKYDIPVLFITGLNDPLTKRRIVELPFASLIVKPFSPFTLKKAVKNSIMGINKSYSITL
jgi:CheY-like chemotaxis protein